MKGKKEKEGEKVEEVKKLTLFHAHHSVIKVSLKKFLFFF
jgi:hypothetical protein